MRSVKFIHCADLHLGSPFKGISSKNPALGAALAAATFDAFRNIVDAALQKKVDFLLIGGDVFDGEDQSLSSRLFLKKELQRLDNAGIKCFIVCGNHDPLLSWSKSLSLPENTVVFESGEPQTHFVERNGEEIAEICGTSFPESKVTANLAKKFKRQRSDIPAVALLHANIDNDSHMNYAPAKLADLEKSGFDYWALGHVHSFKILSDINPAVVYPGCSQGTCPRETGEKYCCLVEFKESQPSVDLIVVDCIRYAFEEVKIDGINTFEELFELLNEHCEKTISLSGSRKTVLRLKLSGGTKLNRELRDEYDSDELCEHLENEIDAFGEMLFLNRVEVSTREVYDVEELKQGGGFISDLISCSEDLETAELESELKAVYKKCRQLEQFNDSELSDIIQSASHLTLEKLLEDGGR
jgi:DNA repair exonuclease SbcCD nuclease subunit